jgi:predicted nuclease of predicted toxin-antitoxin system
VTISLYMDEHVPLAITEGLRRRGVDILTVQEDGRRGYPDPVLLDRALELGRVVFSQDEDFPIEAARRQTEGIDFSGVIYARQTAVSVGDCVRDLELIAKVAEPEDCFNQIQYLPL